MVGRRMALTPPTTAISLSPLRRLRTARCTATSDDEQAVSTARLGPWTPRKKERRPAVEQKELPVPKKASTLCGALAMSSA